MATIKEFADDVKVSQADILALLAVIDEQVEAVFAQVSDPQVPEDVAAEVRAGMEAIKAAAAKIATDD